MRPSFRFCLIVLAFTLAPYGARADGEDCATEWQRYDESSAKSSLELCDDRVAELVAESASLPRATSETDAVPLYLTIEGKSGYAPRSRDAYVSGLAACLGLHAPVPDPLHRAPPVPPLKVCEGRGYDSKRLSTCHDLEKDFDREKERFADAVLLHGFVAPELVTAHLPWVYFAQADERNAIVCGLRAAAALRGIRPIRIVGFSMGAFAAIRLGRALELAGTPAQAGLTFDPVAKGVRAVVPPEMPVVALTPWWNIYQRLDTQTLRVVGIKGRPAPWADRNVEIPALSLGESDDSDSLDRHAHALIFSYPMVRDFGRAFMGQVYPPFPNAGD